MTQMLATNNHLKHQADRLGRELAQNSEKLARKDEELARQVRELAEKNEELAIMQELIDHHERERIHREAQVEKDAGVAGGEEAQVSEAAELPRFRRPFDELRDVDRALWEHSLQDAEHGVLKEISDKLAVLTNTELNAAWDNIRACQDMAQLKAYATTLVEQLVMEIVNTHNLLRLAGTHHGMCEEKSAEIERKTREIEKLGKRVQKAVQCCTEARQATRDKNEQLERRSAEVERLTAELRARDAKEKKLEEQLKEQQAAAKKQEKKLHQAHAQREEQHKKQQADAKKQEKLLRHQHAQLEAQLRQDRQAACEERDRMNTTRHRVLAALSVNDVLARKQHRLLARALRFVFVGAVDAMAEQRKKTAKTMLKAGFERWLHCIADEAAEVAPEQDRGSVGYPQGDPHPHVVDNVNGLWSAVYSVQADNYMMGMNMARVFGIVQNIQQQLNQVQNRTH